MILKDDKLRETLATVNYFSKLYILFVKLKPFYNKVSKKCVGSTVMPIDLLNLKKYPVKVKNDTNNQLQHPTN